MNGKIEVTAGLMAELINFLLALTVGYVIIVDLAEVQCSMWELWILFPVPLFFYLLRKICRKLPIFLVLHLLPLAAPLFLYQDNLVKKVVIIGIVLMYTALSMHKRITSDSREMEAVFPPGAAGVFLALYVIDSIQGKGENGDLVLQMLIFYVSGYFLYVYFRRFLHYVDMNNRTTENIPVGNVFFSSLGLTGIYTVATLLLLTVCSNRELIDGIGKALRKGIRRVISALISFKPGEVQIQVEQQQGGGGGMAFELPPPKDPTLLGQILDVLLSIAVLIFVLIIIGAGIFMAVRLIYNGFYQWRRLRKVQESRQPQEDKVERILRDRSERENRGVSILQRFKRALSPEEKIRRLYKRVIRKGMPVLAEERLAESLQGSTARECCRILFPEKEKEAYIFASLYEKARYSKGMCTGEDVQRAKELCETLLRR